MSCASLYLLLNLLLIWKNSKNFVTAMHSSSPYGEAPSNSDDSAETRARRAMRFRRQNAFDSGSVEIEDESDFDPGTPMAMEYESDSHSEEDTSVAYSRQRNRRTIGSPTGRIHRARMRRSGAVVLRGTRGYQQAIPKETFRRLMRETTQAVVPEFRFRREATELVHNAAESFLVDLFEDANQCTLHASRSTLKPNDLILVLRVRKNPNEGEPGCGDIEN
ncbi:histone H3-like centromeric protein CNA1 [Armigeres subalbatus]|uniref:histone H3-like centromeric protein CNA1 n=1 Tax=Armigeres subalbatus TaxID=124917 RepID=UPI002ED2C067